jgi:uncharacterized protein with PIN domain
MPQKEQTRATIKCCRQFWRGDSWHDMIRQLEWKGCLVLSKKQAVGDFSPFFCKENS